MEKIKSLLQRYSQFIRYVLWGIAAVLVNTLSYDLFYNGWNLPNTVSAVVAWMISVLFAFFTNKTFVFRTHEPSSKKTTKVFLSFFLSRAGTGILDVFLMFIFVDCLHRNAVLWKFLSNEIVAVINYLTSRFLVFNDKKTEQTDCTENREG